jgi:hypothetical protein
MSDRQKNFMALYALTVEQAQLITELTAVIERGQVVTHGCPDGVYHDGHWVIVFRGQAKTIAAWARETHIPVMTLKHRIRSGWSLEQVLTTPVAVARTRVQNRRSA